MSNLANFQSVLSSRGVPITAAVSAYIGNILKTSLSTDRVPIWLNLINNTGMMDEHILLGALSQLDLPYGTVVFPPQSTERMIGLLNNEETRTIKDMASKLKYLVDENSCTVIAPFAHNGHWGMVIVEKGNIWWGDSLNYSPFEGSKRNVVQVMEQIMMEVFPNSTWHIQRNTDRKSSNTYQNFITSRLGYEEQKDAYSCGFYVVSAISTFSESIGDLVVFSYDSYSVNVTNYIRNSAVRAYFRMVEKAFALIEHDARKIRRFCDNDISKIIVMNRMRFVISHSSNHDEKIRYVQPRLRLHHDTALNEFAISVSDPKEFIEGRHEMYEFFNSRRSYTSKKKGTVRNMYTCFRERKGCRATMQARFMEEKNVWLINRRYIHNHGPLSPSPVVVRRG